MKCCVNAPRPCNRRILHETGILNIIVRHSVKDQRKRPEYNLTTVLTELFERHILLRRYPHHLIEAWLTIEEDDGGLFPACVMGLFLALADCGVQMLDTISAASVVCAITLDHMLIQFAFKNPDGSLQLALDLNAHVSRLTIRTSALCVLRGRVSPPAIVDSRSLRLRRKRTTSSSTPVYHVYIWPTAQTLTQWVTCYAQVTA